MSDHESFGLRMRAARERKGISLDEVAEQTKVPAGVWAAMEANDFSRWPTGIFARSYIRDYARLCDLDPDEVVDEFCRLFPIADRRVKPIIEGRARLVGLAPSYQDECLPPEGDRRTDAPPPEKVPVLADVRVRRAFGALVDVLAVGGVSAAASRIFDVDVLPLVAVTALGYYSFSTVVVGRSAGYALIDQLGRRLPRLLHARQGQVEI